MALLAKFVLLLLGVFGNAWLWASVVNRLYGLPYHERFLNRWRHVCELGLIGIPLVLAASLFTFDQSTATAGIALVERDSPFSWWWIWSVPALGLGFYAVRVGRRFLDGPPPGFQELSSTVVDVEAELGFPPTGAGPYHKLLKVPGNQALTVELNEKQFEFANLPAEFDGLRVLHISDLHFLGTITKPYFQDVMRRAAEWKPDLVLFTGDLLDDPELTEWLPDTLGQLDAPLGKFSILGNHDWHLDDRVVRSALRDLGWIDCQSQVCEIRREGASLFIGGDERPWMGDAPEFEPVPAEGFKILLSHTPDNIEWARKRGIDLMLSGHNHGGQIKLPIIGPFLAPSLYGVRFTDGVFHLAPTSLHVSRGVSGRHPLRIRCRPEVTLLHLKRTA